MTRPDARTLFATGPLVLAAMIVLAAMSRLLPHPPNFSPLAAIALFGGACFASKRWAFLVPLAAMVASDLVLGALRGGSYMDYFTTSAYLPGLLANYACLGLTVAMAFGLRGKANGGRVLGYGLAASALFFLVSNLAVWLTAHVVPGHPACNAGLVTCYVAAWPFFKWTVLGTLAYSALLFGGFALLRGQLPALRAQTV